MKKYTLVSLVLLAFTSGATLLSSCATSEDVLPAGERPPSLVPSGPDAAADVDVAEPCVDCEYFPEECTPDRLCPSGPFAMQGGFDPRVQVNLIRGRSANDVWVAGAHGAVAHFDGTAWKTEDIGTLETVRGLWLRDQGEVSLVALDRAYSRGLAIADAGTVSVDGWSLGNTPSVPTNYGGRWGRRLASTWSAAGAEWLWAATQNTCAYNCTHEVENGPSGLWRFRLTPAGFEVGDAVGLDACQRIPCRSMTSIHGLSTRQFWAVGSTGAALRITDADGVDPGVEVFNTQTWDALYGVWMASETEAWAVGTHGLVRHYTGDPLLWDIVSDVPTTKDLRAVWGSSPSDVWVVGDAATVLHYDGKHWSRVKIAGLGRLRPDLRAVWSPSPGHVWIGGQGVVLSLGGKP